MNTLSIHKETINEKYFTKYLNGKYEDYFDLSTDCHITKKILILLFECTTCNESDSNFQTIYFEYKGIGHSCCIYKNKILQSFSKYNHLYITDLDIGLKELYGNIEKYVYLFYPMEFINLNKEINFHYKIRYYQTNVSEEKLKCNLLKLLN